jgi:uncharacterized membrane protein
MSEETVLKKIRLQRLTIKEWDKLADKIGYWVLALFAGIFLLIWSIYFIFGLI